MSEQTSSLPRVFKTGTVWIVEDESMQDLSNEDVRNLLKATYPEVVNATIRENIADEHRIIEFLPQPGRKG